MSRAPAFHLATRLALASSMLLAVRSVPAMPAFAQAIQEELAVPCAVQCTVCHATPQGGLGTVVQPFGVAMKAAGLTDNDAASVTRALNQLAAQATDSNRDGTSDIAELGQGLDPNDGSGLCGPRYGCTLSSPRPGAAQGPIALLLILAWAGLARRRRAGY